MTPNKIPDRRLDRTRELIYIQDDNNLPGMRSIDTPSTKYHNESERDTSTIRRIKKIGNKLHPTTLEIYNNNLTNAAKIKTVKNEVRKKPIKQSMYRQKSTMYNYNQTKV